MCGSAVFGTLSRNRHQGKALTLWSPIKQKEKEQRAARAPTPFWRDSLVIFLQQYHFLKFLWTFRHASNWWLSLQCMYLCVACYIVYRMWHILYVLLIQWWWPDSAERAKKTTRDWGQLRMCCGKSPQSGLAHLKQVICHVLTSLSSLPPADVLAVLFYYLCMLNFDFLTVLWSLERQIPFPHGPSSWLLIT